MPDIYDELIDKGWTENGIADAFKQLGYAEEESAPIVEEIKRRRNTWSPKQDVYNVARGIGGSLTALGSIGAGIVTTGASGVASAAEALGATDFANRVRGNVEDYRSEAEALIRPALKATESDSRGSIVGDVIGGIGRAAEYPLPVRSTFDLADQGVDVQSLGGRALVGARSAIGSAQMALPVGVAGRAMTRLASGAGIGASGAVLDNAALEGAALLDEENRKAYESQQANLKDIGVESGIGAALSLAFGGRAPVIIRDADRKPMIQPVDRGNESNIVAGLSNIPPLEAIRASQALDKAEIPAIRSPDEVATIERNKSGLETGNPEAPLNLEDNIARRADFIAAERADAATARQVERLNAESTLGAAEALARIKSQQARLDDIEASKASALQDVIESNREAQSVARENERNAAIDNARAEMAAAEQAAIEKARQSLGRSEAIGDAVEQTRLANEALRENLRKQRDAQREAVVDEARKRNALAEQQTTLGELDRSVEARAKSRAEIEAGKPNLESTAELSARADDLISNAKQNALDVPSPEKVSPEVQDVADLLDAGVPLKDIIGDMNANGIPSETYIPIVKKAKEIVRAKAVSNARTGGINVPKPLTKAPKPPSAKDVVPVSEMMASSEMMPSDKTTNPTPGSEGSSPATAKAGPLVPERPVDTTPVVESPKPVETPQPEPVAAKSEPVVPEVPKSVETAVKPTETKTPVKPEGKANEEVRQETSPQQAPQEGEVLEDKYYKDKTSKTGYRRWKESTDPKAYEGQTLVTLDEIRAQGPRGEKIARQLARETSAAKQATIGRNPTRSGSTSIPSVLADAIANTVKVGGTKLSGLASETLRTIANSVDTLGSWVNTARAFTYAGNKFKLSNSDRQHINRIEEEYTGILHDMRGVLAKAIQDTIVGVTEGRIGKALRDAAANPEPGSSASLGNGYESKLKLMIEGKIPLTPELEKPIRAMWAINKATHDAAVAAGLDVGKGYPDGVGLNRHFVDDAFEQLMHYPNSEFSIKLKEELARGNNLTLDQVNKHFEQITNLLSGDSTKIVRYDAQEFSRRFKYFPDKIKTSSGWQQVLDVDPNNYINAVSRSLARRAAANKVMGGKTVDAFVKENKVENVDAFVSTLRDFYGISKTPKADMALDSSLARGIMTGVNASTQALLSQSHLGNIGEWSMAANIVPPKYIGTMRKVESGEGGFNFDTRANISDLRGGTHRVNQIIDAGSRMLGSNLVNSFVAKRLFSSAASFYTNSLGDTSGTVRMYGKMGGLSDSLIAKIEDGTATDRDIAVAAATATKHAMGHDLIGSQKAGMENSRIIRALGPAFRSYSQKTMRLIERGIVTAASIARDKTISPQKRATLAAAAIVNPVATVAGNAAFYTAYKAALAGSLAATFAEVMDRLENPSAQSTAWILAQTIGGTYAEIGTHLANPDDMTAVQLGSMLSRPFAMAVGLYDAHEKGIDGAIARVPLINNIRKNLEGKGDIGQARSTFFRVRKELGLAGSFKGDPNDQLWKSTDDIVKAIENGEDYKSLLREAYKVAMRENPSAKFSDIENKIADKLISRTTIFKDEEKLEKAAMDENPVKAKLARDQLRQLRERMAPIKDTLKAYDREIIRIAERIRPPKLEE